MRDDSRGSVRNGLIHIDRRAAIVDERVDAPEQIDEQRDQDRPPRMVARSKPAPLSPWKYS